MVKMYVYNHVGYVIEGAVLDWRGRECIESTTPTIPHLINDTLFMQHEHTSLYYVPSVKYEADFHQLSLTSRPSTSTIKTAA